MPSDGDIAQAGIGQGRKGGLAQVQIIGPGAGRTVVDHLNDDAGPPGRVVGLDAGPAGTRTGPKVGRPNRGSRAIVLADGLAGVTAGEGATKGVIGGMAAEAGGWIRRAILESAEIHLGLGRAHGQEEAHEQKKDPPGFRENDGLGMEVSRNRFQRDRLERV